MSTEVIIGLVVLALFAGFVYYRKKKASETGFSEGVTPKESIKPYKQEK